MQLSRMTDSEENSTIEPNLTSLVIDAVSNITIPTIDPNFINREKSPRPNRGNPKHALLPDKDVFPDPMTLDTDINNETNIALDPLKNREKNPGAAEIRNSVGNFTFEQRYSKRAPDSVIMGVSMVDTHYEIEMPERTMAKRWLTYWNDASPEFKTLLLKGRELGSI